MSLYNCTISAWSCAATFSVLALPIYYAISITTSSPGEMRLSTAIFSVFAYLWLYAVLSLISPGEVQVSEAWITLGFMIALVILAFGMDRWNAYKIKMSKNE
jgi:solute carrier family 8 (sodium/calcium exchanger)